MIDQLSTVTDRQIADGAGVLLALIVMVGCAIAWWSQRGPQ